ncbi:MotE family protein [Anaerosinus gibii]|uniref:Magnesium transporter MgtE n=1 Tax=Selenobaculum gibii TaxID=3054208 RepID=A0A9Y2ET14_9FIRM|nr:magnesium transporter MgtE [Selenobaculum gbiensis]WIW71583.1 magnesium transporter MgtE [Selenobaculum gbiensis]
MAIWRKNNEQTTEATKKPNRFLRLIKILAFILLFLCLIIGGFFLGVYLRVFDVNAMNEKLELYKYPVIGQYFEQPENIDEKEHSDNIELKSKPAAKSEVKQDLLKNNNANGRTNPNSAVVLTKEEIEKQMKLRQAEEKKRISKLARLYNEMKPEDAVKLLEQLDDNMVLAIMGKMEDDQVVQILPLFNTARGAHLTRIMYNGKPPVVTEVR